MREFDDETYRLHVLACVKGPHSINVARAYAFWPDIPLTPLELAIEETLRTSGLDAPNGRG